MEPEMLMYDSLADWWPLLSAPEDYEIEAAHYWAIMSSRASVATILELGCGGGNNASFLKRHATMTLTDLSPAMLEVSRGLNPECEHVQGDMRTLRLGRSFDAVFVHDAIMYLSTREDLLAAMRTAAAHLEPGGIGVFVPDCTRETFISGTNCGGHADASGRGLRYLEWVRKPTRETFNVDMTYVLCDTDGSIRIEHERWVEGLFSRKTWLELMREAGFEAEVVAARADKEVGEVFVGRRMGEGQP